MGMQLRQQLKSQRMMSATIAQRGADLARYRVNTLMLCSERRHMCTGTSLEEAPFSLNQAILQGRPRR